MLLFQRCDLFTPEPAGRCDVLVAGTRVVAMGENIPVPDGLPVEVIRADGLRMIPGLIDNHVHIAGAGGEGGPATRTPEVRLSQLLAGGITTVVGCLGTDGFTRTVEDVLMKAKSLRVEGISCWIYTGAYQIPPPTLLGDVGRDLALVEEVIGVGEVAIADHRSSCPTVSELTRLAEHARVGGMLGGKAGIVNLHMGDAPDPFSLLQQVIQGSELNARQFLPTHCNRTARMLDDASAWAREGYADITTSGYPFFADEEVKPSTAVRVLVEAGVPLEHITLSSDGCGSLPEFDARGNLVRLVTGEPKTLFDEVMDVVRVEGWTLDKALPVATATVADILRLPRKGRLRIGADADMLLIDAQYRIQHMVARGVLMVQDGVPRKKGTFE